MTAVIIAARFSRHCARAAHSTRGIAARFRWNHRRMEPMFQARTRRVAEARDETCNLRDGSRAVAAPGGEGACRQPETQTLASVNLTTQGLGRDNRPVFPPVFHPSWRMTMKLQRTLALSMVA